MWNPFKRDKGGEVVTSSKCNEHESMVKRLARIEGENAIIIIMLGIILLAILERWV